MIEPIEGLNNVEAIAAVEGVDVPAAAASTWTAGISAGLA
jgi:2-keto-3-deoxy-L-rhamnonate aldolase RhmA